jgi:hypothetical protein
MKLIEIQSPYKEEWVNSKDIKRYNEMNEKRQNGIKKARAEGRLPGAEQI